jgi:hypothetical protein
MSSEMSSHDPFAALCDELTNVEPSAGFNARVADRVAASPAAARPTLWFALAGAAALVIVTFAVARRGDVSGVRSAPSTAVVLGVPADPAVKAAPPAERRAPPPPAVLGGVARHTVVSLRAASEADPFVVITSQGAVLDTLWQAASEARTASRGELPATTTLVDADGLLQVPELVVDPIVVLPIAAAGAPGRIQRMVSPQATGSPR